MAMSTKPSPKTLATLAAVQAAQAAADAVPLAAVTHALDGVGFPTRYRWIFPVVKGASAAGLAAGIKFPRIARLTLVMLTGYFVCAVGAHLRARQPLSMALPAFGFLGGYAALAARSFTASEG
jgi:hypothetical protein